MANTLTAARIVLALPFAWLMVRADMRSAVFAALVFIAAIATDLLDGAIARRRGTAGARSGLFDHAADGLFVISGLAAGAARGVFPWILPALVALAFVQYVVDSYWVHRAPALRPSRLGRYNGMLYFAPLGGDVLVRVGFPGLQPAVTALVWLLVLSTIVSMAERLWAVVTLSRTAPVSPAAGTEDRPPR